MNAFCHGSSSFAVAVLRNNAKILYPFTLVCKTVAVYVHALYYQTKDLPLEKWRKKNEQRALGEENESSGLALHVIASPIGAWQLSLASTKRWQEVIPATTKCLCEAPSLRAT